MRRALDVKARSRVLLQSLSYVKFCIRVNGDQTVETGLHCLVRKYVFPMKQKQNVVHVSSTELEESLLKG